MRRHLQIPLPSSEAVDEMLLFSPSEIYHENSKIHPTDFGSFAWIHLVGSSDEIKQIITHPFTHYHGYPQISLPRIFRPTKQSFEDILIKRRSVRAFSGEPISLESLAKILFLSGGITGESHEPSGVVWHLRAAPSGGGLYPVDLYVAALR
ncbi:MAG: nitroreductase family protein, partial [Candidatus Methanomethylicaceae archaeon]